SVELLPGFERQLLFSGQPDPRLVYKRGRLQNRLASIAPQRRTPEPAQLGVDRRHQLLECALVARAPPRQKLADVNLHQNLRNSLIVAADWRLMRRQVQTNDPPAHARDPSHRAAGESGRSLQLRSQVSD